MRRRILVMMAAMIVPGFLGVQVGMAQQNSGSPLMSAVKSGKLPPGKPGQDSVAPEKKDYPKPPKTWEELVERLRKPILVPKKGIIRVGEKYAYPNQFVPTKMEIVKEEGDFVWLRGLPPEDPDSPIHKLWLQRQEDEMNLLVSREFDEKFGFGEGLDFDAPQVPPPTVDALSFEEVGAHLPKMGRWQMGFDVADMNADGKLDLVFPPARKSTPAHPRIFLSDGHGDYRELTGNFWTPEVPYDYGDIKVADFDGDGFLDVVLAIHFKGQYVVYGGPDNDFRRFKKLPAPDPRLTSRGVALADFNRDGRIDCVFEAEINLDMGSKKMIRNRPTAWVVENTKDGWKTAKEGITPYVFGDRVDAGDLNGDGTPEVLLSSNYSGWRAIMYSQKEDGSWEAWNQRHVYRNAYHYDVKGYCPPDGSCSVYAAIEQFSRRGEDNRRRSALVRYRPEKKNDWDTMKPQLINMEDRGSNYYFTIAVGDLNGDGLEDLVAAPKKGGIEVWIQAKGGEFYRNLENGLNTGAIVFSARILDVNGDGIKDIVAGTVENGDSPGGIRVWLSHPKG